MLASGEEIGKDIMTADFYLDDEEERRAKAVKGKNTRDRIIH